MIVKDLDGSANKAEGESMKRITGSAPFKVDKIVFEDGSIMNDKLVALIDNFVLIEEEEGQPPTLFNTNMIRELRGCDATKQKAQAVDYGSNTWRM